MKRFVISIALFLLISLAFTSSIVSATCVGGSSPAPANGTLIACPMYQSNTCCSEANDDVVLDQLSSIVSLLALSTDSCCYSRIQSLICGFTCDPNNSEFSSVVDVNQQGISTIAASVSQEWCDETFLACENIIYPQQPNTTIGRFIESLNAPSVGAAFCSFFSTPNNPSYTPSPTQPIVNIQASSEATALVGDSCNEPNCGLDPEQIPSSQGYVSSTCQNVGDVSCCSEEQNNMLAEKLSNLAIQFGPTDSCCYERINNFLCNQGCDPSSGYYSEFMGVNGQVSTFNTYVCPDFCNETYLACSTAPVLYNPTQTYVPLSYYLNATYPNVEPSAAFCNLFSTNQNDSYVPSASQPVVNVISEKRSFGDLEICYAGEQLECDNLTPTQHCGTDPFRYPNTSQVLVGCPMYTNQSCCLADADVEIAFKTQDKASFFTSYFGFPGDCCNDLITQILCSSACSPTGGEFTKVSPTNTDVNNVTLYVCEDHCRAAYAACKDRTILGTPLDNILKAQNPTEPWAAMCAFFSSENDPTYVPRPDRPNFKARMGTDPYTGICFTGPKPFCEVNNSTSSSGSGELSSQTENASSTINYSILLIVLSLLGLIAINF